MKSAKALLNFSAPAVARRQERQNAYFGTLSRLGRLGIKPCQAGQARRRAYDNGSSLLSELFANGDLDEIAWYKCLAEDLQLEFVEQIDPACLILSGEQSDASIRKAGTVRCLGVKGATFALMAPSQPQAEMLAAALRKTPSLCQSIKIARPETLERALMERSAQRQIKETVNKLPLQAPDFSAKSVLTQKQAFAAGVSVTLLPLAIWLQPALALIMAHLAASLLFGACVLLRVRAARLAKRPRFTMPGLVPGPFPVYSVMVALHHEDAVVPQLCAHLRKLNWPASRLEVLFVCEEGDTATISALRLASKPANSKIVLVSRRSDYNSLRDGVG